MNIRQPEVSALVPVGQAGVVKAHLVQDGGVEVVDGVFGDVVSEFVGGAEREFRRQPPPLQQDAYPPAAPSDRRHKGAMFSLFQAAKEA